MIQLLYILIGVLTGTLFAFYILKSRMEANFQCRQTEIEKDCVSMEERLKYREAEVSNLRNEYSTIKNHLEEAEKNVNLLTTQKAVLEQDNTQIGSLKDKLSEAGSKIEGLMKEKSSLEVNLSELKTSLNQEHKHSEEKLLLLQQSKEQLKLEFKELANKILEEKSQKFTASNKESLSELLNPFKDQIEDFSKKVDECYNLEAKERHTLKSEIKNLQELNNQLSEDALNLTKALKGDTRSQGAWGELILERILEASGLTKGREYETQEGVRNTDGKLLKPDVIVHLPESRDVVIDSKVSLVAYEQFCSTTDETEKQKAQAAHLVSVKNHIKILSAKSYDEVGELKTLDYVLLFMPVEGAFQLAIESDKQLFVKAYEKNIMLVSPSTLLITLRTINKIWQYEYQNRHALEIARKAEILHSKFVGFVENLEKVGKSIQNSQVAYDQAHKQLCSGRGNIVLTCQSLEKLGVNAKKKIPESLLDKAMLSEELEQEKKGRFDYLESTKKY